MNRLQSLDPRIRKLMRAICFCLLFALLFVFLLTGRSFPAQARLRMAWKAGSPKHIEESLAIRSTLCLSATATFTGRFLRWIFFIRPGSHRPSRADLISSFPKCPGIYGIFCATRTRKPSYWKPTVCFQEPIQDSKRNFSAGSRSCQGECGWPGAVEGNEC